MVGWLLMNKKASKKSVAMQFIMMMVLLAIATHTLRHPNTTPQAKFVSCMICCAPGWMKLLHVFFFAVAWICRRYVQHTECKRSSSNKR